jgi:pantothenate kinase type III
VSLIVCDAGHTRLKIHHYTDEVIERWINPLKPFFWPKALNSSINTEVLIMGTNPRMPIRLLSHLRQLGFRNIYRLGIDLRVPLEHNISGAGNDRVAGALGAKQLFPSQQCLVVSAGSAVTMDVMERGHFLGGSIGIGFSAYQKSMSSINPSLSFEENITPEFPGACTAEAVYLGWANPLIETILAASTQTDQIILTGGDAQRLMSPKLKAIYKPWLTADAMAKTMGVCNNAPEKLNENAKPQKA